MLIASTALAPTPAPLPAAPFLVQIPPPRGPPVTVPPVVTFTVWLPAAAPISASMPSKLLALTLPETLTEMLPPVENAVTPAFSPTMVSVIGAPDVPTEMSPVPDVETLMPYWPVPVMVPPAA